jgi:hypothetical protein
VTEAGQALFADFGVTLQPPHGSRRPLCRPCLDWSERRHHLAGVLGAGLFARMMALGWLKRGSERRALVLTPTGRKGLVDFLGREAADIWPASP